MSVVSFVYGLAVGLVGFLVVNKILRYIKNVGRPPLPPGPKGLPLVGNLNDLPKPGAFEAQHWAKHKELYGPISSVTIMGQTIVIVSDLELAIGVLEKRAVKHSSRPKQIFAGEIIGWQNSLAFLQYNDRFRAYRKNISRIIGTKVAASQYDTLQEAEVGHFLLHVLENPDSLIRHIKREAGSVILKIAYGYNPEPFKDDYLIDKVGETMDDFGRAAVPGAFLVDMFPLLRHVPEWFPGTAWKQTGKRWGATLKTVADKPFAFVKHQLSQGKQNASLVSQFLGNGHLTSEEEFVTKWSALSLYTGGADTTVSSIACFFLAMTVFPRVQQKAQEEIDRVVGQDRLPTAADRPNLPYVDALVKELLRWQPVAPMGLPHTSSDDDVVEGYFIPKDAMILPNIWYFTRDPKLYEDPAEFRPERFLPTDGSEPPTDPHKFVFGFGRRVCPGRILADNALFINIAQSLAVFNISKRVEDGREVEPTIKMAPGIITHPEHFETSIKPRSYKHEQLIRSVEKTYPWEESDAKTLQEMRI
ncbi:O-methylsterigmatocystin oxidoreductase [Colletotrichum orbiculare MAFF 240422]|uniref:O-methylsterigmatocystin oxidoreductase n=1 Tax=Colletotrichum orbiculare (strain 104-T / ATCC 96160 / CBS 514.97 / LARS 414 / MAFF 240422) TaxID=1213857 RepID=N4VMJ5_COLOR|nr:O-methylsterigmatocystin oxidoreductase [Colletotrichum orbiculare MAFF 240422]